MSQKKHKVNIERELLTMTDEVVYLKRFKFKNKITNVVRSYGTTRVVAAEP